MNLRQALQKVRKEGRALLATNFYNYETLKGILLAAARKNAPLILQVTSGSVDYMGLSVIVAMAKNLSKELSVQTWLHLDHAQSLDLIERCLQAGFDSVMIDASDRPFEENVELSAQVVQMARSSGALVEAELGYVQKAGESDVQHRFTEPEEARRFVQKTGVDLLAVAIGSAHGFYKKTPQLDIERLKAILQVTDVPLVLHGGSGIAEAQLKAAIQNGICKVNVATETKNAFMHSIKKVMTDSDEIDLRKVFPAGIQAVEQLISKKLQIVSNV